MLLFFYYKESVLTFILKGTNNMNKRFSSIIIVWCLILLSLWVGYEYLYVILAKDASAPQPVVPRASLTDEEKSSIEVFQRMSPSVAFIVTETQEGVLFPSGRAEMRVGAGSGDAARARACG